LEIEEEIPEPAGHLTNALDATLKEVQPAPSSGPESEVITDTTAESSPAPTDAVLFNVFVPEVRDPQRREEAIQLLAEIRGVPIDEARKLAQRLMIPVARDVTKEQAEEILSRFRKIRAFGRMMRATK
jgi:ribosomal protein L7/L12